MKTPICAIFDIGKTNKKLLAFDQNWKVVFETSKKFIEIPDGDGFHGDDLAAISEWMKTEIRSLKSRPDFDLVAVNFSGYGASLVHLDINGQPCTPFYNYLKSMPSAIKTDFFRKYGPAREFCARVSSPDLGYLNSGLQLFGMKHTNPDLFQNIDVSLHLPQYFSYLFSGKKVSERTSIGCHTAIWNFVDNEYDQWLSAENLKSIQQPIVDNSTTYENDGVAIGVGIHDSSSALATYLKVFSEPFILLSTGTWCVSINPFNQEPLTPQELQSDCLQFMTYSGKNVKAARLFAGNENERQIKHLAAYYKVPETVFFEMAYDPQTIKDLRKKHKQATPNSSDVGLLKDCPFVERNIALFKTPQEAYHQFMLDLTAQQVASINLVNNRQSAIKTIFVDGGFANNRIFMKLLSEAFHNLNVFASNLRQASALGAALVIEKAWNPKPFNADIFGLEKI